jgi:hypothetical protein
VTLVLGKLFLKNTANLKTNLLHYYCIGLCEANIAMSSSEDMYLKWGTVGEGEKGMGRGGGGGQYTANQGSEWTGIRATTQRRDSKYVRGEFKE